MPIAPQSTSLRPAAALLLAPLLAVSLAACGGSSSGGEEPESEGSVPSACPTGLDTPAATQPPSDLPKPTGAGQAYDYQTQGATKFWSFALSGEASQLASLRDSYDQQLKAANYEIEGTDQEAGHEAESEFKGAHEGTTNFRMLCPGKVVFRLKLSS
jgi:hypothetical protein